MTTCSFILNFFAFNVTKKLYSGIFACKRKMCLHLLGRYTTDLYEKQLNRETCSSNSAKNEAN